MKRVGEELVHDPKRHKGDIYSLFADSSLQRHVPDLANEIDDATYLRGTVIMAWPARPPTKYRIVLETKLAHITSQVEVEFSGRSAEVFREMGLSFRKEQQIYLSLRGAQVINKKRTNHAAGSVVLKYGDGVTMEILPNGQPGRVVDTWSNQAERSETTPSSDDDWFSTPKNTAAPVLSIEPPSLMVIDEEDCHELPPTLPSSAKIESEQLPVPHVPLNNIGNSLVTAAPPLVSITPTIPPSFSRPSRPVPQIPIDHSSAAVPKENPSDRKQALTKYSTVPPSTKAADPIVDPFPFSTKDEPQPAAPAPADESASTSTVTKPSVSNSKPVEQPLTKKQRKNKSRKEKKKAKLAPKADSPQTAAVSEQISAVNRNTSAPVAPLASPTAPPSVAPPASPHLDTLVAGDTSSTSISSPSVAPPSSPHLDTLVAGDTSSTSISPPPPIQVPRGFTALANIKAANKWLPCSIIGVVTSYRPAVRSKRNDWTCSLRCVDPTNVAGSFSTLQEGLLVNMFTPKYSQWLPADALAEGDIIILHEIKVKLNNYGDIDATGYHDKAKWAIYKPKTGQVEYGDLPADVPRSDRLADGFGAEITPFYPANDVDVAYCGKLHDWWQEIEEKRRIDRGDFHQLEGVESAYQPPAYQPPSGRKHLLICEAKPESYFNCTVEVLNVHKNDSFNGGPSYTIYVTDYTTANGAFPCQANWAPPALAEFILKIELWDAAAEMGSQMDCGDVYYLDNVRLRIGGGGHTEAKLVEKRSRTRKLEAADATDIHLKALLERKQAHSSIIDAEPEKDLKLIQQGEDRKLMSCLVELLHKEDAGGKSSRTIYVTDYTRHSRITAIAETWAHGLDGFVLKVLLSDGQADMADKMVVGDLYTIEDLRLQYSVTAQEFRGTLGGSLRLIHRLNSQSGKYEDQKQELIQRRTDLKKKNTQPRTVVNFPQPAPARFSHQGRACVSIKQVKESTECPKTFVVRARVVDFHPLQLNESFARRCLNCSGIIHSKRTTCAKCDSNNADVDLVCMLRILIEDEEGEELKLSVSGDVPLLDGLDPVVLLDDPEAAEKFRQRMGPVIANLAEVHDGILRNEQVEPSGSELTLTVDSWRAQGGSIVYGLRQYES